MDLAKDSNKDIETKTLGITNELVLKALEREGPLNYELTDGVLINILK
jgi:hypothetical protein